MKKYPDNDSSTTRPLDGTSNYDRSNKTPLFEIPDLSFIAKATLYICLTVIIIVFVNSCQVDKEMITQCEASCSTNGNRMDSVSMWGCDCAQKDSIQPDVWVLPGE